MQWTRVRSSRAENCISLLQPDVQWISGFLSFVLSLGFQDLVREISQMPAPTVVAPRENIWGYQDIRNRKIIQNIFSIFALQSYWDDISPGCIISHEMGNTEEVQSVIIISTILVNGFWSQIVSLLSIWAGDGGGGGGVWRIFYLGVTMFPPLCKNVKIPHWEYNSFVWDWDGLSTPDIQMIKLSTLTTAFYQIKECGNPFVMTIISL